MLDTRFGVISYIPESMVDEYIKRGHRLVDVPSAPASEEVEVKKPRTRKPRTKKQ